MEEECFKFSLTQSGLFEIEDSYTNINEIKSHICMHNPNLHIGNKNFFIHRQTALQSFRHISDNQFNYSYK